MYCICYLVHCVYMYTHVHEWLNSHVFTLLYVYPLYSHTCMYITCIFSSLFNLSRVYVQLIYSFLSSFFRLSKLEAISQTVSEFDSIKNPLEAWCLSQQEVISSLPLLDTNLEELEKQRQHLEKILHDIETHKDEVDKIDELTDKFSQHREVQYSTV